MLNFLSRYDKSLLVPTIVFVEEDIAAAGQYRQPERREYSFDGKFYSCDKGIITLAAKYPETHETHCFTSFVITGSVTTSSGKISRDGRGRLPTRSKNTRRQSCATFQSGTNVTLCSSNSNTLRTTTTEHGSICSSGRINWKCEAEHFVDVNKMLPEQ